MHFLPNERVALFIDGANLYSASRNLGFDVDYRNLLEFFRKKTHVVRAYYYSAVLETEEYSPLKPLTDWLAYNGYTLVTKPAKEFTDSAGRRRVKGNMDIEVAVDMLELAPRIDHAVLFSGDSDFRRLVDAVQRKGVRVSVVSSIRTSPPMVADELRRQADQFVELADIAPEFTRRQTEPRTRRRRRCGRPPPTRSRNRTTRHERSAVPPHALSPDAPARDCPLCPRLVAYRHGEPRRQPGLVQRAGAELRAADGAAARGRHGARGPRRQPHRPAVHRRPRRRAAIRNVAALRASLRASIAADPEDGLALHDCRIVNAVRCVPPANLPEPLKSEPATGSSPPSSQAMRQLRAVLALGVLAHAAVLRACGIPPTRIRFRHGEHARAAGRPVAGRQLPCVALQHEHRPADGSHVPERRRSHHGAAGVTA